MNPLLKVDGLEAIFSGDTKDFKVLNQVGFSVGTGEILCIVGESGSGKSVTVQSLMGILGKNGKVTKGSVFFNGEDLLGKTERELDEIRGNQMTMIFQDAMTSLNPVFTIGSQMIETMRVHLNIDKKTARDRAASLLKKVGLPNPFALMKKYPHTLSGGMRQRVMIAMALACGPKLLIADEPTTALDVTIQAQIMELLRTIRKELKMSIILITHDLGLVAEMADRVLVMYAGQVVEEAGVMELFEHPKHPYTKALLTSIPSIRDDRERVLTSIEGTVPENYGDMKGCRFANRCPYAVEECHREQVLAKVGKDHTSRCFRSLDLEGQSYGE